VGKENESPIIRFIKDRIKKNKNCIIVIVGGTGSGKSWAALTLAQALDPNFGIDHIAFLAAKFMAMVNKDFPPGSVLMWDEGGVELGSREFMSKKNRLLSKVLQTVRYKNHIIILTVPDLKFIDAHARKLAHLILRTQHISAKKGLNYLSAYNISITPLTGDIYYPHPRIRTTSGRLVSIKRIAVKKPSAELIKKYEIIKKKFGDDLNASTQKELEGTKDPKLLNKSEQAVYMGTEYKHTDEEMAKVAGVSRRQIRHIKKSLRERGYIIPMRGG